MHLDTREQQSLDDYRTMYGESAGSLALVLDQLTDVMAMIGQHNVYCRVQKGPRAGEPPLDVVELLQTLQKAKSLVQETLQTLRKQ
jgi:hypothetical protein